ncbi:MAG: TlpA family protein disulfide reductase [Proteobacteria bacterium]|nr:TlpA family protein disulfide reductase [Pseudomonadota bacterium]
MSRTLVFVVIAAVWLAFGAPAVAATAGAAAPAFTLDDAAGKPVSLAALRGKVVVVDFWASWCGPCRQAFPWMNALQQKYAGKGLVIVAVNVDKKRSDADRFLAQVPAQFTTVFDPDGKTPAAFDVRGMPTTYLVDGSGKIVLVEEGFREETRDAMEARIRALLGT